MKWYLHKIHRAHLRDLKVSRGDDLEIYYPWVGQIANTFSRNSVASGVLNYQDLIQAGYEGLIRAWESVDHNKDQAQKWTYIKKRIKWSIRREIDKYGAFISKPINKQEDLRNKLLPADKALVDNYPKFFDYTKLVVYKPDPSWINEQLFELIDDYLYLKFKNIDHVEILKAMFGIDRDEKASVKELAHKYRKSEIGIKKIRERMLIKLREDEEFKKIIENFYNN